jgi:signal transduction histidine kinase
MAIVHPADRDAARHIVDEAARRGGDFNVEYRVVNGSEPRWLMACGRAVRNTNGRPLRFIGIVMDISERKRAEAALVRSEKLASLGRLAATVAHEINNPLAAIMNLLYLAKNSPDAPSTQRFLDTADEELKRVSHITRQALGFYREGSVPAVVSIGEILDSTVGLLQSRIHARQATIEKQYDDNVQLTAVAGELRQVVSNLLANSLDAVQENGIITLRASYGRCPDGRRCVRLTVADNGKGIAPTDRLQIFEALFTTKDLTGTGLGLWVTKQLVEKHGGSIRVRSATRGARRGTTICVTLPAQFETAAPKARTQAAGSVE